jgi:hypothetical protein
VLEIEAVMVGCPYCGESIELLVDCPEGVHDYIEDCQVCCRPIAVRAEVHADGAARLWVAHEDET